MRAHKYTHSCARARKQLNKKAWYLGNYKVEADAAAARDVVARVLGLHLNFERPREITGQRTKGADKFVADAVKAANTFMLGTQPDFICLCPIHTSPNPEYTPTVPG